MLALVLLSLALASEAAKLPKTWQTCKIGGPNENECLTKAIQSAITELARGNPSLGVLPLDPMHFNQLTIDQGSGPVTIRLDFKELDMSGLGKLKVKKVVNNWKHMELHCNIPSEPLVLEGGYKINGKVLVLPINGDGHCYLSLKNFTPVLKLKLSETTKGGKKYYHVDSFDIDFTTDHFQMKFDNLFNGDKALGDNMNVFLNENWKEILQELKPAIVRAFNVAFKEVSNRIFSKLETNIISPH